MVSSNNTRNLSHCYRDLTCNVWEAAGIRWRHRKRLIHDDCCGVCHLTKNDPTLMKKTALRNETYLRRFNEGMWLLMMSLLFCHHEQSNSIQCELNKIVAMWVWSECHLIYDGKTVICSVLWGEICLGHRKVHSHIQHHNASFQERWS